MSNEIKVKINVSIAGERFAFQPGQIVMLDSDLARKWIANGHAARTNEPLTTQRDLLGDLSAAEALSHRCVHCEKRAKFVFENKPYCL